MKLLRTITDSDIFGGEKKPHDDYTPRPAARAVFFDSDNKIAILHVTKNKYHKLPGSGVDEGESMEQGLARELLEETGCRSNIVSEIGEIVEYRDNYKIKNDSFCWIAYRKR